MINQLVLFCDLHCFHLVHLFAKLAPKGVQHQFGSGLSSSIFLDVLGVLVYPLSCLVIFNIIFFLHIHLCPAGVTTTSLFYLQPCVYLRGKQTLLSLVWWEMPCFLYAKNLEPFFNSFYDFGRTPSTSEHAILSHHDYNNFFTTSFWQFHLPHIFDITETSVFHVEGATRDCINYRAVKRRPSRYCSRWLDLGRIPKNFRVTHGVGAVCVYAGIL